MSLVTRISELAERIAQEIKAVRLEITQVQTDAQSSGNIDGGNASSVFGGSVLIDGGTANG